MIQSVTVCVWTSLWSASKHINRIITSPDVVFFSWLAPRLVKFTDDIFVVFIFLPLSVKFALTSSTVFYTLHNHTNSPLLYTHAHLCKTWREWHAYRPITASGIQTMRSRGGAYYINMTMATLSLSVSYLIKGPELILLYL